MKKIIVIMILAMIFLSVSYGQQLFPPIQPYNENGYNNQDFITFSLNLEKDSVLRLKYWELSASYREQLLLKVNNFLRENGLDKKCNNGEPLKGESGIRWIFDEGRTWAEDRVYPDGYWNSHQSFDGKSAVPYWDKKYFRGPVNVLHVEGYSLDLAKIICMNSAYDPKISTQKSEVPCQKEISLDDKIKLRRVTSLPYDYGDYNKKVVMKIDMGLTYHHEKVKTKTWFGRNWPWVAGAAVGLAGGTYYLVNQHYHHYYGGPGGAPMTKEKTHVEPVVPVVTPPVEPGGPGGAPLTPGGRNIHSLTFALRF